MRNILIFSLIGLLVFSCSKDDGNVEDDFYFQILPVENAEVPSVFASGNTYQIQYTYRRPTNCHFFNDLYFVSEGNTRTIAVTSYVTDEAANGTACESFQDVIVSQSFDFTATNIIGSTYTFKFWQGVNEESGEDTFLIIDVPVLE